MFIFFAFIGLSLGLFIGGGENIWSIILSGLGTLLLLPLAIKKKAVVPYLSFIAAGILIALIRFIPFKGDSPFQGIVIESKENYFVFLSGFRKFYVYSQSNSFEFGDILSIEGKVSPFSFTTYESRFDFGKYLLSNGVRGEMSSRKINVLFSNPIRLRSIEDKFLSHFDVETSSLLSSLLFNQKEIASTSLSNASSLSLLSLYSSSGILLSLFLRGYRRILKPKYSEKAIDVSSIAFLTFFLPFYLRKIGIWRVYLCNALRCANKHLLKRRFSSLEITGLSGLFLLSINHYSVYQTGFLLGYGISIILYFSRTLLERVKRRWKNFAITGLIHLCILPSHVYSSNGVHLLSILYCLVSLPLVVPFAVLGWLSFLSVPFVCLLNGYGDFLRRVLSLFMDIDIFIPLPSLHPIWVFLFYFLLVVSLYFLEIGGRIFYKASIVFLFSVYSISLLPIPSLISDQVSFINVGQGDSILIRDNFTTVLLDTGGNKSFDMAEEVLIPYLRKERIYKIDCLIASHGDFDHIGAKESLIRNFNVARFVDSPNEFPLRIGGLYFTNYNTYGETGENESSLVLGLSFMDKRWLFTGDAPSSIEKRIIADYPDIDCDILKVGHHGSDTSTSFPFVEKITPEEAIISVGANNKYGHPKDSVLKVLRSKGVKIRRTDQEGTISYRKISFWWV
ncbi:MAG: MBL fold metallo-hydrolase [Bacilli bacterium]|nr:MBL fold metallo-hydrolase [Bacilli bacterium]